MELYRMATMTKKKPLSLKEVNLKLNCASQLSDDSFADIVPQKSNANSLFQLPVSLRMELGKIHNDNRKLTLDIENLSRAVKKLEQLIQNERKSKTKEKIEKRIET